MIADRRLYLTADKSEVVEEGDARAAFLFVTPGKEISAADAERYGLSETKAAPKAEDKQAPAPANKARKAPARKSK